MNIHMDALMDYLACPQLHKYRHVDKIDASSGGASVNSQGTRRVVASIDEAYDRALHKTVASMFNLVQEGTYPTISLLRRKWGFLWVKPRSEQEDVRFKEVSWRDRHDEKRKQGWTKLESLYHHYDAGGWGSPLLVDFEYTVPIGNHTLSGRVDLVRVVRGPNGREYIELVEFLNDERYAPYVHIRRDWRVTAASYAFRHLMNVSEEKIVYHGIISGKLKTTERGPEDHLQLERLLDHVERSINEGIYFPRFDERCLTCPYEKRCEKGWYHVEDQKQ